MDKRAPLASKKFLSECVFACLDMLMDQCVCEVEKAAKLDKFNCQHMF